MSDKSQQQDLLAEIREAFAGVVLGNGVGLREADALDDYADRATIRECRRQDEKLDWSAIPGGELEAHFSASPCYFDPEGMRFHLPAFLSAYLAGLSNDDFASFLTSGSLHSFSLLNEQQRSVVRKYLLFLQAERAAGRLASELASISESLRTVWVE